MAVRVALRRRRLVIAAIVALVAAAGVVAVVVARSHDTGIGEQVQLTAAISTTENDTAPRVARSRVASASIGSTWAYHDGVLATADGLEVRVAPLFGAGHPGWTVRRRVRGETVERIAIRDGAIAILYSDRWLSVRSLRTGTALWRQRLPVVGPELETYVEMRMMTAHAVVVSQDTRQTFRFHIARDSGVQTVRWPKDCADPQFFGDDQRIYLLARCDSDLAVSRVRALSIGGKQLWAKRFPASVFEVRPSAAGGVLSWDDVDSTFHELDEFGHSFTARVRLPKPLSIGGDLADVADDGVALTAGRTYADANEVSLRVSSTTGDIGWIARLPYGIRTRSAIVSGDRLYEVEQLDAGKAPRGYPEGCDLVTRDWRDGRELARVRIGDVSNGECATPLATDDGRLVLHDSEGADPFDTSAAASLVVYG